MNKGEASLIENRQYMISLADQNFNVAYHSPAVQNITGWTIDERLNVDIEEQIHPADKEKITSVMRQVLENPGKPTPVTFRKSWKWRKIFILVYPEPATC